MRKHPLKLISVLALASLAIFCIPQRAAADDDDPPTRVARLSHVDGSVSFEPAGTDDWVSAVVNRPITTGDKLWADHDSRAELHIGAASIRLGSSTGFSFLNLDDRTVQLQLTEGTLRIRVLRLDRDDIFEVDTPNLAFSILRPGVYRVSVNEAGDSTVVNVRDGEGQVTGGGETFSVHANETGTFTGADQLNADIVGLGNDDDLERWSEERDRRDDHATARRYVSDDVVGYEDLDEYGRWRDVPEYGTVWFPQVATAGWAPYRYGHWVYIQPWGYTWVDDQPWGFAPFHYGRWIAVRGAWGWVPCRPRAVVGVEYVRPVYAPALVAWIGGPHFAVGIAVGGASSVGWFPLGPREVYVPSYRVSRTYVNNVNVSNTTVNTTVVNNYYNTTVVNQTTVTNVRYVNQREPGAVTATSTQVFTSSQSVGRNVVRVDERQIASAPVVMRTPAMAPERQAFVGAGRPASARPPERIVNRAVVARTAPPPPPASVERQQVAIRQNGGQPLGISQARQIEPLQKTVAAPVRMAPPGRPAQPQNNEGNRRGEQPQNNMRPGREDGNARQNVPQNNRPNVPPANAEQPGNVQPNRPTVNDQPATPPVNNNRPNNQRNDRPASARPDNNRPDQPQNDLRPGREGGNVPQQNARPNTPSANAEQPGNAQPNRPPVNNQPATPPVNNDRPNNQRNDRPASARPDNNRPDQPQNSVRPGREGGNAPQNNRPNTPPANAEQLGNVQPNRPAVNNQPAAPPVNNDRPNNQRNDRPASPRPDNSRPDTQPASAQPNRPPANDRPVNEQQGRQQPPPRQQPQVQQQQPRPPQAERQQPTPHQQQEKPKQQDKPKEKEKDKPPKG